MQTDIVLEEKLSQDGGMKVIGVENGYVTLELTKLVITEVTNWHFSLACFVVCKEDIAWLVAMECWYLTEKSVGSRTELQQPYYQKWQA